MMNFDDILGPLENKYGLGSLPATDTDPLTELESKYGVNDPPPKPAKKPTTVDRLSDLARKAGFTITSTTGGKHNKNSRHYRREAIDVHTRDKSPAEIQAFMDNLRGQGVRVLDERTRPPGQAVWGGPHLHLDLGDASTKDVESRTTGIPIGLPDRPMATITAGSPDELQLYPNRSGQSDPSLYPKRLGQTVQEFGKELLTGGGQPTGQPRALPQILDGPGPAPGEIPPVSGFQIEGPEDARKKYADFLAKNKLQPGVDSLAAFNAEEQAAVQRENLTALQKNPLYPKYKAFIDKNPNLEAGSKESIDAFNATLPQTPAGTQQAKLDIESGMPVIHGEYDLPMVMRPVAATGQPITDNSIIGVVKVDPSWDEEKKLRYAARAVLGQYGVTNEEIDKWIRSARATGQRNAVVQGDRSADEFAIKANMLMQIKGEKDARYQLESELTQRGFEADRGIPTNDPRDLPAAVAERNLEARIQEPGYIAQEKAAKAIRNVLNDPVDFLLNPWGAYVQGAQLREPFDPTAEKTRLVDKYGGYTEAWKAEDRYLNEPLPITIGRIAGQTARSFAKNLLSGTGKTIAFLSDLTEKMTPIVPEQYRPGVRNAMNIADLLVRLTTSRDATTAYNEWERDTDATPLEKQLTFKALKEFDDAVGDDPVLKDRFLGEISDAAGSALAFVALGAVMPSLSIEKALLSRTALRLGLGRTLARSARSIGDLALETGASGAMQALGSGYEEGRRSGLNESDARLYALWQGLWGTTEMLGSGTKLGRLIKNPEVRSKFAQGMLELAQKGRRVLREGYKEGKEEFWQEFSQTTGGNAGLAYLKDKEPATYQKVINALKRLPDQIAKGITHEALYGGIIGALMGGGTSILEQSLAVHQAVWKEPSLRKLTDDEIKLSYQILSKGLAEGAEEVRPTYNKIIKEAKRRRLELEPVDTTQQPPPPAAAATALKKETPAVEQDQDSTYQPRFTADTNIEDAEFVDPESLAGTARQASEHKVSQRPLQIEDQVYVPDKNGVGREGVIVDIAGTGANKLALVEFEDGSYETVELQKLHDKESVIQAREAYAADRARAGAQVGDVTIPTVTSPALTNSNGTIVLERPTANATEALNEIGFQTISSGFFQQIKPETQGIGPRFAVALTRKPTQVITKIAQKHGLEITKHPRERGTYYISHPTLKAEDYPKATTIFDAFAQDILNRKGKKGATLVYPVDQEAEQSKGFELLGGTGPQPTSAVGRLKEQRDAARRQSETDSLTGLANREALDRALPAAEADPNVSVGVVDANNFGQVNKKASQKAGDQALIEIARALQQAAKEHGSTRVFRRGGDEFVVLAPPDKIDQILRRAEELYGEKDYKGTKVSITGTSGNTFDEADAILQKAKAKRKGLPAPTAAPTATYVPITQEDRNYTYHSTDDIEKLEGILRDGLRPGHASDVRGQGIDGPYVLVYEGKQKGLKPVAHRPGDFIGSVQGKPKAIIVDDEQFADQPPLDELLAIMERTYDEIVPLYEKSEAGTITPEEAARLKRLERRSDSEERRYFDAKERDDRGEYKIQNSETILAEAKALGDKYGIPVVRGIRTDEDPDTLQVPAGSLSTDKNGPGEIVFAGLDDTELSPLAQSMAKRREESRLNIESIAARIGVDPADLEEIPVLPEVGDVGWLKYQMSQFLLDPVNQDLFEATASAMLGSDPQVLEMANGHYTERQAVMAAIMDVWAGKEGAERSSYMAPEQWDNAIRRYAADLPTAVVDAMVAAGAATAEWHKNMIDFLEDPEVVQEFVTAAAANRLINVKKLVALGVSKYGKATKGPDGLSDKTIEKALTRTVSGRFQTELVRRSSKRAGKNFDPRVQSSSEGEITFAGLDDDTQNTAYVLLPEPLAKNRTLGTQHIDRTTMSQHGYGLYLHTQPSSLRAANIATKLGLPADVAATAPMPGTLYQVHVKPPVSHFLHMNKPIWKQSLYVLDALRQEPKLWNRLMAIEKARYNSIDGDQIYSIAAQYALKKRYGVNAKRTFEMDLRGAELLNALGIAGTRFYDHLGPEDAEDVEDIEATIKKETRRIFELVKDADRAMAADRPVEASTAKAKARVYQAYLPLLKEKLEKAKANPRRSNYVVFDPKKDLEIDTFYKGRWPDAPEVKDEPVFAGLDDDALNKAEDTNTVINQLRPYTIRAWPAIERVADKTGSIKLTSLRSVREQKGVSKGEADLITAAADYLESALAPTEGSELPQTATIDQVRAAIAVSAMPLTTFRTKSFADYGLSRIGPDKYDAWTYIYNTPWNLDSVGHFFRDYTKSKDPVIWEIREVFDPIRQRIVYAAIDTAGAPVTQEGLMDRIGTASDNRSSVEKWITDQKGRNEMIHAGLFGHMRVMYDDVDGVWITEHQADLYEKKSNLDMLETMYRSRFFPQALIPPQTRELLDEILERQVAWRHILRTIWRPSQHTMTAGEVLQDPDVERRLRARNGGWPYAQEVAQKYDAIPELVRQAIETLPPTLRQLFRHKKNHLQRLVRETIYREASAGKKTLYFPAPQTAARIEGFNVLGSHRLPYITDKEGDLEVGDEIRVGEIPYIVIRTNERLSEFVAAQARTITKIDQRTFLDQLPYHHARSLITQISQMNSSVDSPVSISRHPSIEDLKFSFDVLLDNTRLADFNDIYITPRLRWLFSEAVSKHVPRLQDDYLISNFYKHIANRLLDLWRDVAEEKGSAWVARNEDGLLYSTPIKLSQIVDAVRKAGSTDIAPHPDLLLTQGDLFIPSFTADTSYELFTAADNWLADALKKREPYGPFYNIDFVEPIERALREVYDQIPLVLPQAWDAAVGYVRDLELQSENEFDSALTIPGFHLEGEAWTRQDEHGNDIVFNAYNPYAWEVFSQPSRFSQRDQADPSTSWLDALPDSQRGIVQKYIDTERWLIKTRPDIDRIVDAHGNEWLKTTLTEADKGDIAVFTDTRNTVARYERMAKRMLKEHSDTPVEELARHEGAKQKGDVLIVDPETNQLIRKVLMEAYQKHFGLFMGSYMPPNIASVLMAGLHSLRRKLNAAGQAQEAAALERTIQTIENAMDPEWRDLLLETEFDGIPSEITKNVTAEEALHRADYRIRMGHTLPDDGFLKIPGYQTATAFLRARPFYRNSTDTQIHMEIIAKIFRDDYEEELGITSLERKQIERAYLKQLLQADIKPADIIEYFEGVNSPYVAEFIQDAQAQSSNDEAGGVTNAAGQVNAGGTLEGSPPATATAGGGGGAVNTRNRTAVGGAEPNDGELTFAGLDDPPTDEELDPENIKAQVDAFLVKWAPTFIKEGDRHSFADLALNSYRSGLLCAIGPIKTNLYGNTANIVIEQLAHVMAAGIDWSRRAVTGDKHGRATGRMPSDIIAGFQELITEGIFGKQGMLEVFKSGVADAPELARYEFEPATLTEEDIGKGLKQLQEMPTSLKVPYIAVRIFTESIKRAFIGIDRPFSAFARGAERNALARKAAKNRWRAGEVSSWREEMQRQLAAEDPVREDLAVMEGRISTYQNPNLLTDAIEMARTAALTGSWIKGKKATNELRTIGRIAGAAGYVGFTAEVPFLRTVSNFGARSLEYFPPYAALKAGVMLATAGHTAETLPKWMPERMRKVLTLRQRSHDLANLEKFYEKETAKIKSRWNKEDAQILKDAKEREDAFSRQAERNAAKRQAADERIRKSNLSNKQKLEALIRNEEAHADFTRRIQAKKAQNEADMKAAFEELKAVRNENTAARKATYEQQYKEREQYHNEREESEVAQVIGRGGLGALAMMPFFYGLVSGLLQSLGVVDYDEEQSRSRKLREAGIPQESTKLPYTDYRIPMRGTPLTKMLSIYASTYDQFERPGTTGQKLSGAGKAVFRGALTLNPILDPSFREEGTILNPTPEWAGRKAVNMIPGVNAGIWRELGEVLDDKPRTTYKQGFLGPLWRQVYRANLPVSQNPMAGRGDMWRRAKRLLLEPPQGNFQVMPQGSIERTPYPEPVGEQEWRRPRRRR